MPTEPSYNDEGMRRLYLAIVLRAIEDLNKHPEDFTLKAWLKKDGLFILESYDQPIDSESWEILIDSGFPKISHHSRIRK